MHKSFANSSLHHSIHMFPHISINFSIIFQQNSRRRRVSELYKILPKICIFFSNGFVIVQCYVKMPPQKCVFCADETLWSSFSQKLGSLPRLWRGMKHLIKFSVTMNHFDHWKRLTIDKTTWKSSCRWTGIYHPTKVRWRRWQHPKLQPWFKKTSQIDCRWICGTDCWLCESVFTHSLWCYTLALAEPLKQHESFKNDKRKHIESFFELLIRTKKTFWKMICA